MKLSSTRSATCDDDHCHQMVVGTCFNPACRMDVCLAHGHYAEDEKFYCNGCHPNKEKYLLLDSPLPTLQA